MPINLVIDQNVLRKDVPLRAAIADVKGRGEKLVLPDMALAEMMKADQWETTTRASLRILAETPDVVVVSHALGPLMKVECDTGEPTKDVVDVDVTPRFQELLSELHRGDGPAVARIKTTIDEARALAAGQHFAHARNKEHVKKIVEACKHDLTKDELTLARREDEGFLRQLLASASMTRTCRDALVGAGYDEKRANGLAIERSISSHEFLTFASIALRWLNGLDGAAEAKVTNDLADKDYVVIATFCRGIVSEETRVRQQFDRMIAVANERARSLHALLAAAGDA